MITQRTQLNQFKLNIFANLGYFFVNLGIGVWLVPYLINNLGIAVYGLVPLAVSISSYLGLVTVPFNMSVSRFLTIDLQKKDFAMANQTFNTAFWGSLLVSLCMLPFVVLGSFFIPNLLNTPYGYETVSRVFFFLMASAFLLTSVSSNFSVSCFSKNRLDILMILQAIGLLVRILIIVVIFKCIQAQIWHIGIGFFGGTLIIFAGGIWAQRKLTPELKIKLFCLDRSRLRSLLGMGGWVFVNQLGALFFLNIDLVVINRIFGPETVGRYGALLQWVIVLRSLCGILSALFTPTIYSYYAQKNYDQIVRLAKTGIKFLGLMLSVPIGLICGFASPLLSIWLGSDFSKLAPLLWILVGPLCITLAVRPSFSIQQAFNKVRIPGIVTLIAGGLNLFLAIFFPLVLGWGMYGIAAAGAITLILKNGIFTPWHIGRISNTSWYYIMRSVFPGVLGAGVLAIASFGISTIARLTNWSELGAWSAGISLFYIPVAIFLLLSPEERKLIYFFALKKRF